MRALLASILALASACSVPTVDDFDDARMVLAENGYRVVETPHLPVAGLTDCMDKVVFVRPDVYLPSVLVHEAVHVLQAEEMGCARFYAKRAVDPDQVEHPAYVAQYQFLDCDSSVLEEIVPQLSSDQCD